MPLAGSARTEGRAESTIRTRLTLAFLAPAVQRAILAGTLGPEWTTDRILRRDLPADGSAQTCILGH